MESKTCTKCKKTKDANLINFAKDKRTPTGLTSRCRKCTNDAAKLKYRKNNPKNIKVEPSVIEKEIPIVILPNVNLFKGRNYSIQVPRQGKGMEARVVRGKVIQETDKLVVIQTKNYIESFSKWELAKYKVMEV